jgi:hypothetical protein
MQGTENRKRERLHEARKASKVFDFIRRLFGNERGCGMRGRRGFRVHVRSISLSGMIGPFLSFERVRSITS